MGTEYNEQVPYPFFDPKVDSVVLMDSFMGCNPPMSTTALGLYGTDSVIGRSRDSVDLDKLDHFKIIQSLHIPAHAWDWELIRRAPRAGIRFTNLTEIVLQGGEVGLMYPWEIERGKTRVRACFGRAREEMNDGENEDDSGGLVDDYQRRLFKLTNRLMQVPEVLICMPKGLGYELMFEEEKLGMESVEERNWVTNFIAKVKKIQRG